MNYRKFIEEYFTIDEAGSGALIPFKFNKVQQAYYKILCETYGQEKNFEKAREIILKARREGFTSLILGLFTADLILATEPRIAMEISYKEDATKQHLRRVKTYAESCFRKMYPNQNPQKFLDVSNRNEIVFKHNKASFYVGTASAKVGERGGTVQRLLLSEAAHYPNTDIMTAKEIVNSSMRMVDINAGWIFIESTANGKGNTYADMWQQASIGQSRFKPRFFGWKDFYSQEEFNLIKSEFSDQDMVPQEYPENPEEAFLVSVDAFLKLEDLELMVKNKSNPKELVAWLELGGMNYIEQAEVIKSWLWSLQKTHHQRNLYVGIDSAKSPDHTVVTVLLGKNIGMGEIKSIAIDSTGQGDFLPDWFERNFRSFIMRVKFTAQQKDAMYKNLRQVIENKATELPYFDTPESKNFLKEMTELQMERKGELILVHHPIGGKYHDDYADSWALAEWGYVYLHGAPKTASRPAEIPPSKLDEMLNTKEVELSMPTQFR